MMTPPPVSGASYPNSVGSEEKTNFLRAGFGFSAGYDNNVLAGSVTTPTAAMNYAISPTISLDQTTARQHRTFTYNPSFILYEPTSSLNQISENLAASFEYRLSPHISVSLRESFQKSSNGFDDTGSSSTGTVSGSGQPPPASVIAPYGDRITNQSNAMITYQVARNGMIGGGGTFTELDYPNPSQVSGLSNSDSRRGSAFYNHRLNDLFYVGASYQYSRVLSNSVSIQSETQTQSLSAFCTIYLKRAFSISVSGGPQHFDDSQTSSPTTHSLSSTEAASVGWQGTRTSFALAYSRAISGGGGLIGAFDSTSASASARWQLSQNWTVSSTATYLLNKNVTPLSSLSSSGGTGISVTASAQHRIGQLLTAQLDYQRLHQSYDGIPVISSDPNSDRISISISYQLTRPLGR